MDIEAQPFDLRECVESALDLVGARAAEKHLDTRLRVRGRRAGRRSSGDVTRLRQILLNLLANAVKFTERGEVVLTVTREPATGGSVELTFAVRDTGIGLTRRRHEPAVPVVLARPTRRPRASTAAPASGLAISKRLAELMGGTMWAESDGPGQGLDVPLHDRRAGRRRCPPARRRDFVGVQPALQGKRVLVVDDNATNRRVLALQTAKWGMAPRDTESPREALRWLARRRARSTSRSSTCTCRRWTASRWRGAIRAARADAAAGAVQLARPARGRRRRRRCSPPTSRKPLRQSQLFDTLVGAARAATPRRRPRSAAPKPTLDPEHGGAPSAAHPAGRGQRREPEARAAPAAADGLPRRPRVATASRRSSRCERQTYDVVLMDVQMPEMDGLEATRRIAAQLAAGERPRIVAMTANAMQGDREMCLAAGMDDYLTKPIRVERWSRR